MNPPLRNRCSIAKQSTIQYFGEEKRNLKDSFMFEPHGEYHLFWQGNQLHIRLAGSFNKQGAQRYVEDVKQAILGMNKKPFVILIDADDFDGATPDAYQVSEALSEWLANTAMQAKAIVSKSELKVDTAKVFEPGLNKVNVRNFSDEESAQKWLAEFTVQR